MLKNGNRNDLPIHVQPITIFFKAVVALELNLSKFHTKVCFNENTILTQEQLECFLLQINEIYIITTFVLNSQ